MEDFEEITKEDLSDFLKFMRESIKYNKLKFSQLIGIDYTSYRNWENGKFMTRDEDTLSNLIYTVRTVVKEIHRDSRKLTKREKLSCK